VPVDIHVDDLVPIALLEEQEAALATHLRNAEVRVEKQRAIVARARERLAALDADLERNRKAEREAQEEIRKAQSLRSSAQRALDQGLGNAAAVEHQLATCAATLDRAETEVLELMMARDELTPIRAGVAKELDDAAAALTALEAETKPAVAAWKAEAQRAAAERQALRAKLPRDLGAAYDAVVARRGSGLARVVDKVCTACARAVPSQRLIDVRAGRLVQCDGCSRWLWIPAT
jgi:predicted  nucleic acid-binding Zn-ribbon protein